MFFVLAQSVTQRYTSYYLDLLLSPMGVSGIVLFVLAAISVAATDATKWVLLGGLIHIATYSVRSLLAPSLIAPFTQIASASQALSIGCLLILAIAAVRGVEWPRNPLHPALVSLYCFQLVHFGVMSIGGYWEKGIGSIAVLTLMMLVLGLGQSRWLNNHRHALNLLRAVGLGGVLTMFTSVALVVISPGSALQGRLLGTTGNPQRLSAVLSLVLPYLLGLHFDKTNSQQSRTFNLFAAVFAVILVIGTGSRMGGLVVVVGLVFYFRTRLGSVLLYIGMASIVLFLGFLALGQVFSSGQEHMLSTVDSRSEIWTEMWGKFMSSPILGVAYESAHGESTYLSVAAGSGIVGLLPFGVFIWLLLSGTVQLYRARRQLGSMQVLTDVAIASVAQLVVIWVFEALLLGTVTDHTILVYCTLGLLGFLRQQLKVAAQIGSPIDCEPTGEGIPAYTYAPV